MTLVTYTYQTKAGINEESFSSTGYITLVQNGLHKYEHHFGSHLINLQEQMLVSELIKRNIEFSKTIQTK